MRRLPIALAAAVILGCGEAGPVALPPVERSAVWGTVIDHNGRPVEGAEVELSGSEGTTSDDGTYVIDGVEVGDAELVVRSLGSAFRRRVQVLPRVAELPPVVITGPDVAVRLESPSLGPAQLVPTIGVTSYASPSPDGARLAVEIFANQTRGFDIWAIDLATGASETLVSTPDFDENPRWSPDGRFVAFHRTNVMGRDSAKDVWLLDLASRELRRLANGFAPAWSPDSRWVIYGRYVEGNADVYKTHVETGETVRLTRHPARDIYPSWGVLAGEERVVFSSRRADSEGKVYDIWSVAPDGSDPRQLTRVGVQCGNRMFGPVIAPDGRTVAFWEFDRKRDHSLWLVDADGGNPRRVLHHAANPNFAPTSASGTHLYLNSKRTGRAQIWRLGPTPSAPSATPAPSQNPCTDDAA